MTWLYIGAGWVLLAIVVGLYVGRRIRNGHGPRKGGRP